MDKVIIKELKDIIWKEGIVDPTDILLRFYEIKGVKLSDDDKRIIRYFRPETILRETRNFSKPTSNPRQTNLTDSISLR